MTERENMELIFQHQAPEYIPHLSNDTYVIADCVVERPIMTTEKDAWGCNWISCPTSLGITHPDTHDLKFEDLDNWKNDLKIPDLDAVDFAPMIDEAKAFTDRNRKMVQYVSLNGIFERTHILMGFENALCAFMEEPEEYGEMLKEIADHKIRLIKKVYELIQPDILTYHDDMATQASQFLPTAFYVKYLFPQYKRIVEAAREIGYQYVVQHSCGRIEQLIPDWLACGFDGWDSVMPCNDLATVKKEFGDKIVFLSGLDTQGVLGNPRSTRQEIETMVVKYLNLLASDGTGFIFDSSVMYSLNPVNEQICLEFIQKHGKPFMDAKKAGIEYVPELEV